MKRNIIICLMPFFCLASYAQSIKSYLPTPAFSAALEKIVLDFKYGYHNIQVDSLSSKDNGYETYASSVTLPGSTDNVILRFHSVQDTTASFQSTFYQGDDYNEAVRSYKTCIHLLKKSLFGWLDKSPTTFTGKEEDPDPNISFASSTLRVNNKKDPQYKNFCADIELTGDVSGWKVYVNFETRAADTDGPTE